MAKTKDISQKKFGLLTAIKPVGKDKNGSTTWLCVCECGGEKVTSSRCLLGGGTKSCGCLAKKARTENMKTLNGFYHGRSNEKLYHVWLAMRSRCTNPNSKDFHYYGARGITVCDEWLNSFEAFYDHVSQIPHFGEAGYSLDRINNDGNYEAGNVRWATASQQSHNRRPKKPKGVNTKWN